MKPIEMTRQTCRRCGKSFVIPSYYIVVPNYCDECIVKLIKEGVAKPYVSRRKATKK